MKAKIHEFPKRKLNVMVKLINAICIVIIFTASSFAQAPNKMSYQAVIRNNSNVLITNQAVGMRISILQGATNGAAVYLETQTPTTNINGLASIEIGAGAVVIGNFAAINWANGPYFIKTETDPNGGTNYSITGTSQLLSVPYALFCGNGVPAGGISGQVLTYCNGSLIWTNGGQCPGIIAALNCTSATNNGTLISGSIAISVSSSIPYTGGNGGAHNGQSIASTGVTGLTATLASGNFANGSGNLIYIISGTPNTSGIASFALNIGGQTCILTRTVNLPVGTITTLNCGSSTNIGTLIAGTVASGASASIPYTGGNGGTHNGQIVSSTGVTGLTANLAAGTFATGTGNLIYTITGTPSTSGTASFALNIGGQSCLLLWVVQPQYPAGSVFCGNGPTAIVQVTNPITGKIWMDRNLGATQAATSSTDANSYGDLYQWGRRADGHQCRTSATITTLSSVDQPANGNFIIAPNTPFDWRSPQNNNLWQGVNGVNNPCPIGFRLPTQTELNNELTRFSPQNSSGAFSSPLKLTIAGRRIGADGTLFEVGVQGIYWSSTVSSTYSSVLYFGTSSLNIGINVRGSAFSVRCIKN